MAAITETDMEARIARLESDVGHLRTDVAEIRLDVRALRDKLDDTRDRIETSELRLTQRIETAEGRLTERMEAMEIRLDGRIDGLPGKMDEVGTRLDGRIDGLAGKMDEMGTRLLPSDEWHLKPASAMVHRWRHAPEGIAATLAIAEQCEFRLEQLRPTLPDFPLPPGVSADEYLVRLVVQGAEERLKQGEGGRVKSEEEHSPSPFTLHSSLPQWLPPAHRKQLGELIEHGHVVEIVNKTPPEIAKFFSWRSDLGVWTLVIFGLLLFVLSKVAWPRMLAGLQKREANIRGALDEAQKARDDAAALRAQFQKEMDGAHLKVKEILDEARRDAQHTTEDMIAKAKTEIDAERERAHREITVETDQALQTIWNKAADLATQVSAAALGKQLDTKMHRRLIDEALDDLKAAARN